MYLFHGPPVSSILVQSVSQNAIGLRNRQSKNEAPPLFRFENRYLDSKPKLAR